MSVNREELKRLIDFIGYLNIKRERGAIEQMDLELLSKDKEIQTS